MVGLAGRLRSLPHGVRILVLYTLVGATGAFMYSGLVTPFARSLGMTPSAIGLYFTIFSLVSVCGSLLGGVLGDLTGRRRMVVVGRLVWASQVALFVFVRDWRWFFFIAVVRGLADVCVGAVHAIAAEVTGDSNRATVFGILAMVNALAGVYAPVLGGMIADNFGARAGFLAALPAMLLAAYLGARLPERTGQARPARTASSSMDLKRIPRVLRDPNYMLARVVLVFGIFNGIHNGIQQLIVPLWVQDRFGAAYAGVSGLSAASSLGAMITSVAGGRLADRYGKGRVAALLFAAGLLPTALILATTRIWQVYLISFLVSLIGNAATPGFQALMVECVPEGLRSSWVGGYMATFSLAFGGANALAGRLYTVSPGFGFAIYYLTLLVELLLVFRVLKLMTGRLPGLTVPEAAERTGVPTATQTTERTGVPIESRS